MDVGRNERCPCGSGKKYKHCCIDKNRSERAAPGVAAGVQGNVPPGTCDGRGPTGRCGKPGGGTMWCKVCGKVYTHCGAHQAGVSQAMNGHVMRVHPETIPTEKFDQLLSNEPMLAELRRQADAEPELWKTFFEYVEKRKQGHAVKPPTTSGTIDDRARELRDRAMGSKGEMVRWYDGAWEFLLSLGLPLPDGKNVPMWGFSAMLYPAGRGSTKSDWVHLHHWANAVGVPKGQAEIGDTIRQSPNAVHKWMWMEDPPAAHPN
jgi:hypothetical protein